MPTLAEILDTLAWYRPLEEIVSDEGIVIVKISISEIRIEFGKESKVIKLEYDPS